MLMSERFWEEHADDRDDNVSIGYVMLFALYEITLMVVMTASVLLICRYLQSMCADVCLSIGILYSGL